MIDLRPIFMIVGMLLMILAVTMMLPVIIDLWYNQNDWQSFFISSTITFFVGILLFFTTRSPNYTLCTRQAFILTAASWIFVAAFGSLPFILSHLHLSYTDAFFETMSGITTTGSTIIIGLDYAPQGLLLWRSLLQWLGGVGIIFMALTVLPMLRVGGMQLFRIENPNQGEKTIPRLASLSYTLGLIYISLTAFCAFLMFLLGMKPFDAINHAMTTISTGGFSTKDSSIAYFNNPALDFGITLTMLTGAMPFLLYLKFVRGNPEEFFKDMQVRGLLSLIAVVILVLSIWHHFNNNIDLLHSFRYVSFNVVSIITGTGFVTASYDQWGYFPLCTFFFMMFIGGCAGSTTCGVKIFRLQILFETTKIQFQHMLRPHGVFIPYYNGKPLPEKISHSVLSFLFLFFFTFLALSFGLTLLGLDVLTATSAVATSISNVGPGLGLVVGPEGNFSTLPDMAKWLLSAGMLIGRLEIFTIFILFTPSFWTK